MFQGHHRDYVSESAEEHHQDEASKSLKITQLFTHDCHDSLSIIYLKQNLFHKIQCACSLNSDYMVIFKNPQNNSQFATIARQIHPDKWKFIVQPYKDTT